MNRRIVSLAFLTVLVVGWTPFWGPETMRAGAVYVGLPPGEIEELREKCLAENPDSLCLPLPVDPTLPGFKMEEVLDTSWDIENRYLRLDVPKGAVVRSPLTLEKGSLKGFFQRSHRYIDDEVAGTEVDLVWYLTEESAPFFFIRVGRGDGQDYCVCIADIPEVGSYCLQTEENELANRCSGSIDAGDPLLRVVADGFGLNLGLARKGIVTGQNGVRSRLPRLTLDDLLRDAQGRIVFVLPQDLSPAYSGVGDSNPRFRRARRIQRFF